MHSAHKISNSVPWQFCVAPMLDWTDRHCRYFHRLLAPHALLYSEMIHAGAVLYGARQRLLAFNFQEHPVALQLGGSDSKVLADAAEIGAEFGYREINLNIGCPSERVQNGAFGACLMAEPQLVGDCVAAMLHKSKVSVTVKCRIGIDDQDPQTSLFSMAEVVRQAGAAALIVHARKAWLKGLSPKENREIPPLDYSLVYELKSHYRDWPIAINGGITSVAAIIEHLRLVDGVMIGRAAYHHPMFLNEVEAMIFKGERRAGKSVIADYCCYIESQLGEGVPLQVLVRPLFGMFTCLPGARKYRRYLSQNAGKLAAGIEIVQQAMEFVDERQFREGIDFSAGEKTCR